MTQLDLQSVFAESNAAELDSSSLVRWWVIHTGPRCEKKMDAWLAKSFWEHYLPTRPKKSSYASKTITFEHPLFPSYTFGRFNLYQRNAVYGSGYAAAVLEVVDQENFLEELRQLRAVLSAGTDVRECAFLKVGQRARVTLGKLRGLEGVILQHSSKTHLILSVEMLQRSVSVQVEPEWLELVV